MLGAGGGGEAASLQTMGLSPWIAGASVSLAGRAHLSPLRPCRRLERGERAANWLPCCLTLHQWQRMKMKRLSGLRHRSHLYDRDRGGFWECAMDDSSPHGLTWLPFASLSFRLCSNRLPQWSPFLPIARPSPLSEWALDTLRSLSHPI